MVTVHQTEKIPLAIIGLGGMGHNHLRVSLESNDFEVVAVVDSDLKVLRRLTNLEPAVTKFRSITDFLDSAIRCDAAIVAAPTSVHFQLTKELLSAGIHVLVEKPLASTMEQGQQLIEMAKRKRCLLAVGHVERHNPVVSKLGEIIGKGWLGKPIHFSVTRVGGYPRHINTGTNVLLDLAVHDIDVLRSLLGPLQIVASCCHRSLNRKLFDTAEILLRNRSGTSASVHVNWITPTKIRNLRVAGTKGVCFLDYILQSCVLLGGNLLSPPESLRTDFEGLLDQYQNSDRIEFGVKQEEPLRIQLYQFARQLRGLNSKLCSGIDGLAAVALAEQALRASSNKKIGMFY